MARGTTPWKQAADRAHSRANEPQRATGVCSLYRTALDIRIGTLTHWTQDTLGGIRNYSSRSGRSIATGPHRAGYPGYGFTPAAGPISNQLVKTGMSIATGWRQSGQDSFADAMIALPQSRQAQ